MNLKQACKCLNIKEKDIDSLTAKQLKHKYHILALKYHPDKNKSLDAKERFQEIQEAYETICMDKQIPKHKMDYRSILKQYLSYYIKDSDVIVDLLYDKLNNKIDIILDKCSRSKLITIYIFLYSQQRLLHIPDIVLSKIQDYIHKKTMHIEIECSFKDIWEQKIYILELETDTLYIPLWHSKLSYDIQGNVYEVTCKCKEKHIVIDRLNNVHIKLQKPTYIKNEYDIPILGKRYIPISPDINNSIVLKGEGIPIINEDNMYDNTYLSDIILTVVN